jgi:hypothetical protein
MLARHVWLLSLFYWLIFSPVLYSQVLLLFSAVYPRLRVIAHSVKLLLTLLVDLAHQFVLSGTHLGGTLANGVRQIKPASGEAFSSIPGYAPSWL